MFLKPQSAFTSLVVISLCTAMGGSLKGEAFGDGKARNHHPQAALEDTTLPMVAFPEPWTSPYHVDSDYPFHVVMYLCTRTSGQTVRTASAQVRLPAGSYRITFQRPADLGVIRTREHRSDGLNQTDRIVLPGFADDLIVTVSRL